MLERLHEQIQGLDQVIEKELAQKYPDVAAISQPSGVGVLTALGLPADAREQGALRQEPHGGSLPRTATAKGAVRGRRSAVADHQGRRSIRATTVGDERQLHPGSVRQGQRPTTVGAGAGPSAAAKTRRSGPKVAVARKLA